MTSGINWIFDHVEECIFLEDDCLPSASFFPFCEQLLERYRHDEQIMHINGFSYQFGRVTNSGQLLLLPYYLPLGMGHVAARVAAF